MSNFQFSAVADSFTAESDPVAHLAYGQLVSLDAFNAIDSGGLELTISADGGTATVFNHFTGTTGTVNNITADIKPQGWAVMDFTNYSPAAGGIPLFADTITITVFTKDKQYNITVNIGAGTTPAGAAAAVAAALQDNGFTNVTVNGAGTVVTLKGPAPNDEAFTGFGFSHTNTDNRMPGINTSTF